MRCFGSWIFAPFGSSGYNAGIMENGLLKEQEAEDQRYDRVSSWWVNNRENVKRAGYGLFIALDAVLLCVAAWAFTDGFFVSYQKERLAVAEMVAYGQADLHARSQAETAQALEPGDAVVLSGEGNTSDVYAPLTNPNKDWWAEFSYVFIADGVSTKPQQGFILPNQAGKPLIALGTTELKGVRAVSISLENIVWHRVDRHVTGEPDAWAKTRLALTVKDAAFKTDVPFGGKTIGQAAFTVINDSSYSYYRPSFVVLLRRGASVVGLNRTTIDALDTGASRDVAISWFGALPAVGSVEVIPDINIFDTNAYKALTGETTLDVRERVFTK